MVQHVFVLGLDETNREMLERLPAADACRFHTLVHHDELRGVAEFHVPDLLAAAQRRLRSAPSSVDGIVTLLDFPATELVPILARRFGTRAPSLEAVLRCSHKYWSRLCQRAVAPECVPGFEVFDPAVPGVADHLQLDYPFWVKPLNAYRSRLGFRIDSAEDLAAVLPVLRDELPRLADPLDFVLKQADVPEDIAGLGSAICLAEGFIGGRQCTLEGYVHGGRAEVYGVVDSVRDANRPTFARYQYPSSLPRPVQARMTEVAVHVMEHIGYDDGCFNVEFFWERRSDRIWLLEINPRLSQSHCELFERVDGVSNAQVMVDVALGRPPAPPRGAGEAAVAAKFFIRAFRDGIVTRVPNPEEVAAVQAAVPGAHISVLVEAGAVLEELADQDSYSYELATVRLGAPDERELLRRYRQVQAGLPFTIDSVA
jgi:biotin carboxylase